MERNAQHAFDAEEVMAYLDGELEARRAAALAAHLVSCSECKEVAQGFRALSERMLSFEVENRSVAMSEAMLAALDSVKPANASGANDAEARNGWKWQRFAFNPRTWAIAGAVIVVAMLVIGIPMARQGHTVADLQAIRERSNAADKYALRKIEPAAPRPGPDVYQTSTETEGTDTLVPAPASPPTGDELKAPENVGPMIVQMASLTILATNYDAASVAIEKLAAARGGYLEKLDAKAQTGNARELTASLRIPTKQLDGFLADVRKLGHVEEENRENQEVSDHYVDLQARLKSAQATEQRLIELLGTRTGKLQDVLEAERELARVRGEIESMQGQSALLVHRVNYSTVKVNLNEEYRQVLGSGTISTGTKIRNAAVEGFSNLEAGAVALLVFLFALGPSLLFWLAIFLIPGWFVWKRFRRRTQG
jgi:Flp pilus assembly protein TadB